MEHHWEVIPLHSPQPPSITPVASYEDFRGSGIPLIIDNGSTNLRCGFATSPVPHSGPNIISKYKDRRTNRPILLFGEAVEIETGAKAQSRTPWEGDVLLNFDALECALDHSFLKLGIDTEAINHSVLMTERISTPLHSRALTSELLFELYRVPSATYCLDSLLSFYYNNTLEANPELNSDGLVISFNSSSTSIIPLLDGRGILSLSKRIPWGVTQCSEYLLKLIQLKYPNFPGRINASQTNWMYRKFCTFSTDYITQLRILQDPSQMRIGTKVVQFPFLPVVDVEKTDEELARTAERRREQGKRLQEMAMKVRLEKLTQKEHDFNYLSALKNERALMGKREWMAKLHAEDIENDTVLEDMLKKLDLALKKARKRDVEADETIDEPLFPLLEVPDEELDEDQLKEKRKQRLMKAGHEARVRVRKEKEKEREERAAEERKEEDERNHNLSAWSTRTRQQHDRLMLKIRERARRKAALSDRKSAAAQARMKHIANLASDEKMGRKRRKTTADDTFGANDDDWAIYRAINIAVPSSDEEEDVMQLEVMEHKLLQHDPTFTINDTYAAINSSRSALLSAFRPEYADGDIAGQNRIHLNVERWRVPETYFNPSMAGVDSAGIGEVLQGILASFSEAERARLAKNVFIAGSPSALPGLVTRIRSTLRPLLAPEVDLSIKVASNPSFDTWKGMAKFALTHEFAKVAISKAEYEEWGGERIRRWWGSNWNSAF